MNRKNIIKKLDQLWHKRVIERDKVCQWRQSGCLGQGTDPHHVFYRRYMGTRFMLANGVTLCAVCHVRAHARPDEFMTWWEGRVGEKAEIIRQESLNVSKYIDYESIERGLK